MKKYLICLSILLSFCFISNVKAYFTYNGVTYDENKITELARTAFNDSSFEPKNYYVQCNYYRTANPNYVFDCYFMEHPYTTMTKYSSSSYSNSYKVYGQTGNSSTSGEIKYRYFFSYNLKTGGWFSKNTSTGYKTFSSSWGGNIFTNFDYTLDGTQVSSKLDFNPKPYTFNFHLNDGYLHNDDIDFSADKDFSVTLYKDEIDGFFRYLELNKSTMIFEGFYYDKNFKSPFNPITDNLDNHVYLENDDKFIDLYAKWRYEHVDDFLANTTFNEYTFDTLYDYAIITKGDNSGDVYLGLNFNKFDITVYEYKEELLNYDKERGFCLVPMYSKDGIYYYMLDTSKIEEIEVLVLPKSTFENNNYNFLLTNNAYVTYTNNLEEVVIYDSNGNQITTNLEETYQNFQESMINEENDLLTIFKNLTKLKDNNIFKNIDTIWNKFKLTSIYNYLMILIVGSLIIIIVKAAKRK